MKNTITHSEGNKGWTSFWNYFPDGFLNNNGDRNRINNAPHSSYLLYVDDVADRAAGLIKGNVYYNTTIGGLTSVV